MSNSKYIVGIDLGTSNSILAYTPAEMDDEAVSEIQILEIPQISGPGSVAARSMLPSFIFLPGEKDMSPDALNLPWQKDVSQVVGEPPFSGILRHKGWQVGKMNLPTLSGRQNAEIIAPAEVEIT